MLEENDLQMIWLYIYIYIRKCVLFRQSNVATEQPYKYFPIRSVPDAKELWQFAQFLAV